MTQETTCCFTGHRPEKLPWGTDETDPRCVALRSRMLQAVSRAYGAGMRHFICGMARGCDLMFAQVVLELRQCHDDVTVEGARPCESQASGWPKQEQARYYDILDQCDYETLVQHQYDRGCMLRRNRYMVDRSALVISVYDGLAKGGTANTLAYALKTGRRVDIISIE